MGDQSGLGLIGERAIAAQHVDRAPARHLQQPRRGIVWHTPQGPGVQRGDQRLLHDVFGKLEVPGAQRACQQGHEAAALMTKQVGHQARHLRVFHYAGSSSISRISIEPKARCGESLMIATAWS